MAGQGSPERVSPFLDAAEAAEEGDDFGLISSPSSSASSIEFSANSLPQSYPVRPERGGVSASRPFDHAKPRLSPAACCFDILTARLAAPVARRCCHPSV